MERKIHTTVDALKRSKLDIRAGDTVRVGLKIQEKGKTRVQSFEGLVIAVKHGREARGTFTVRKVASGVGVERIFPRYSPVIDKIEIVRRAKARRAKLYFIREKVAREISKKMRKARAMQAVAEETLEEIPAETIAAEAENTAEAALA